MQTVSREVLARWQVRKTKKQKRAFEAFLLRALREAGYAVEALAPVRHMAENVIEFD